MYASDPLGSATKCATYVVCDEELEKYLSLNSIDLTVVHRAERPTQQARGPIPCIPPTTPRHSIPRCSSLLLLLLPAATTPPRVVRRGRAVEDGPRRGPSIPRSRGLPRAGPVRRVQKRVESGLEAGGIGGRKEPREGGGCWQEGAEREGGGEGCIYVLLRGCRGWKEDRNTAPPLPSRPNKFIVMVVSRVQNMPPRPLACPEGFVFSFPSQQNKSTHISHDLGTNKNPYISYIYNSLLSLPSSL